MPTKRLYRRYGISDKRFVRCFLPIDVGYYDSIVARRECCRREVRSALGIPANHKVLLTVGKLLPRKRQADLVRLSNSLQGQRNDVTVLLAGSGPDEASLRAMAHRLEPGGVVFAGFVPPHLLANATVPPTFTFTVPTTNRTHSPSPRRSTAVFRWSCPTGVAATDRPTMCSLASTDSSTVAVT